MENNVDEDLIEATIRRVAAQKAAIEDGDDVPPPPPSPKDREDQIEDTIRRVAASKKALAAAAPAPDAADEDPIEATIRRVAAQKAALEAEAEAPTQAAQPTPIAAPEPIAQSASVDEEDPIEATIRRVAAEKAAREADGATGAAPVAASSAPTPAPAPEPARPSLRSFAPSSHYEPGPPPADSPWSQRLSPAVGAEPDVRQSSDDGVLARIEQKLDETARTLVHIASRVDALAAQLGNAPTPINAPRRSEQPTDDEWDDTPVIPRLSGMPPRPSALRDPSPMTATAEQLQPELIDNRPLPKPLPPIHADAPRRGLDLLPRTYRVTVEDKRRGVDLVPLHRALLGMDGVKDMSLLSYNNGVAIVALDTTSDLDPELLRSCISRAMSREAKVEVHNEHTMVVKLAED